MHFAVGMCGGAALLAVPCLIRRKGWRHIPFAMTLGGLWAIIPDSPRLWREDFTSLPFAATLGAKDFELWLHSIGNLFFMHQSLDAQPKEFALLGLAMIVGLYNLSLIGMWWQARHDSSMPAIPSIKHQTNTRQQATDADSVELNAVNDLSLDTTASNEQDTDPVIGRIKAG